MVFGEAHLNLLVREFLEHYHTERPHQAKDNEVLTMPKDKPPKQQRKKSNPDKSGFGVLMCRERLGGLLKSYRRAA